MNNKEKAIKYAREVCPELIKGCRYCGGTGDGADNPMSDNGECYPCEICKGTGKGKTCKTLHLEHWLRVIKDCYMIRFEDENTIKIVAKMGINASACYDLTKDGMSQSEDFYKLICDVCNL